jgi:hypothetical protein
MSQSVKLVSVATAVPPYVLEQRDVAAAAHRSFALRFTDFELVTTGPYRFLSHPNYFVRDWRDRNLATLPRPALVCSDLLCLECNRSNGPSPGRECRVDWTALSISIELCSAIPAVCTETWSVFDLVAHQNRPARGICVPSVPKVSAGRSISVGNGEKRPGARRHRSNPIPCRGEGQTPVHANPIRRLSRSCSPRASPSPDQHEVLPTETMTKAQNEIRYPSPSHEPNTGSDGFNASVEVSW